MAQLELPEFVVKPSQEYKGWLVVTCPREDCGDFFLVRKKTWVKPLRYTTHKGETPLITGRSCPYCFRAGAIPARLRSRYNQGPTTNTTRR